MMFCQRCCGLSKEINHLQLARFSAHQLQLTNRKNPGKFEIPSHPPEDKTTDWIGPPDEDSNLRPYKIHVPADETLLQQKLRIERIQNQNWNQQFWADHNINYSKQKEEFIEKKQAQIGVGIDGKPRKLTSEQMSEFYKKFLDEKYNLHKDYNKEWYRRNVKQTYISFKVYLRNIFHTSS